MQSFHFLANISLNNLIPMKKIEEGTYCIVHITFRFQQFRNLLSVLHLKSDHTDDSLLEHCEQRSNACKFALTVMKLI